MNGCPQCAGINPRDCFLCNPRRGLRKDDKVTFLEFGQTLYQGVVTAMRPTEFHVEWSDGVVGKFECKYANKFQVIT